MTHDAPPLSATAAPGADLSAAPQRRQAALIFIFITVTIDTIAMGVTAPVLPQLIERMSGSASQAGWMNGLFMAAFSLMQFLFSPILGALSDRYGRRPILLLSIAGLGLSYAGMAMATNVWELLLIRLFTGATSANIATAFAYIADVTPADRRAGAYGMMQGAMSLGFALGPGLGGVLGKIDPTLPFWVAAGISLINAGYGFFVVPESLARDRRAPFQVKNLGSFGGLSLLRSKPDLFRLAMILVMAQFAFMVFPTVFVFYAGTRYRWGIDAVGACLTAFGVCSGLVQAGLSGRIVRALGARRVIIFGVLCGVVGTFVFGIAPTAWVFAIGIPIMTLSGVSGPAVQSLMTRQVSSSEQGRLQGANASLQSLAGIVAPLLFGGVWAAVVAVKGKDLYQLGAPFFLASAILVCAVILASQPLKSEPARV